LDDAHLLGGVTNTGVDLPVVLGEDVVTVENRTSGGHQEGMDAHTQGAQKDFLI